MFKKNPLMKNYGNERQKKGKNCLIDTVKILLFDVKTRLQG